MTFTIAHFHHQPCAQNSSPEMGVSTWPTRREETPRRERLKHEFIDGLLAALMPWHKREPARM